MKIANCKKVILLGTLAAAGVYAPLVLGDVETDAKTAVFDALDKQSVVIDFAKGSATLDDSAKKSLQALTKAQDAALERLKVAVAAWSDREYPAGEKDTLTKNDIKLADVRATAIKEYVRGLGKFSSVTNFNMAEKVSDFQKIFNTKDAQVKESLAGNPTSNAEMLYLAKVFKKKGHPNAATVVIYDADEIKRVN